MGHEMAEPSRHLTRNGSPPLVGRRDFLIEYVACLSNVSMHTSRIAEEWVTWCSEEFKFMTAADCVSTGRSVPITSSHQPSSTTSILL